MLTPQQTIDSLFLSIAREIADRHGLTLEIDIDTRTVNFVGGTDVHQLAAAFELHEKLGGCAA